MARLTEKNAQGMYEVAAAAIVEQADGYGGEAIEKLAKFENAYDELLQIQQMIAADLDRLRQEGRNNSHQFKEKLAYKTMNANTLSLFQSYGL